MSNVEPVLALTPAFLEDTRVIVPSQLLQPTFNDLGLIVIPVLIEGELRQHWINLLLDTGAQKTVLRQAAHRLIGVKLEGKSAHVNTTPSKTKANVGTVKDIRIGAISLGISEVLVDDLGAVGEKLEKHNVAGILGANSLRELCLKIDYPKIILEIHKSHQSV